VSIYRIRPVTAASEDNRTFTRRWALDKRTDGGPWKTVRTFPTESEARKARAFLEVK
jgi:hypothetical protein